MPALLLTIVVAFVELPPTACGDKKVPRNDQKEIRCEKIDGACGGACGVQGKKEKRRFVGKADQLILRGKARRKAELYDEKGVEVWGTGGADGGKLGGDKRERGAGWIEPGCGGLALSWSTFQTETSVMWCLVASLPAKGHPLCYCTVYVVLVRVATQPRRVNPGNSCDWPGKRWACERKDGRKGRRLIGFRDTGVSTMHCTEIWGTGLIIRATCGTNFDESAFR